MHLRSLASLCLIFTLALSGALPSGVLLASRAQAAESESELGEPPAGSTLQEKITEDEAKQSGLEGEVRSIQESVVQIEATLKLAQGKQTETEATIKKLAVESTALLPELKNRTAEYDRRRSILRQAMEIDYKQKPGTAVELIVQSDSVSQTLTKTKYLDAVQDKLDGLSEAAQRAYDDLKDKKSELDGKRSTVEVLARQLVAIRQGVEHQRAELNELAVNRANEASYLSSKIETAKKQQEALLTAAGDDRPEAQLGGTFTNGASVRQGDVIGFEGSTGFSTGCHTHFSVVEGGRWVNPGLHWASLRQPDGSMTQNYGMTSWARTGAYGGSIHNGIDVVQGCGKPVRAAADGMIVRDNRTDGSGFGHYIMIRHNGGLVTLYGHLI